MAHLAGNVSDILDIMGWSTVARACLALLGACYRPGSSPDCVGASCEADDANLSGDGMVTSDGPGDGPPGQTCIGTSPLRLCVPTAPTNPETFVVGFNTDSAACPMRISHGGRDVCIVLGQSITVTGSASFTGSRPLVLAASGDITINANATLDVSSSVTLLPREGAGANPMGFMECFESQSGINDTDGSAGGSFASPGGAGGMGDGGMGGGLPAGMPAGMAFRGGCAGAPGPVTSPAGPGGGAVYLMANGMIKIDGDVEANGGGGTGGQPGEGGAGGGSGGYIGIDAMNIVYGINSRIVATGGGGGGGGCTSTGTAGGNGFNPSADVPLAMGGAGAPDNNTGDGGNGGGAQSGVTAGNGIGTTSPTCGGGGGGGGAGMIRIFQSTNPCVAPICKPAASNQ